MNGQDRRVYQRGTHFYTEAKISKDGVKWIEAEIYDFSSGGLKLYTDELFKTGEVLWFDLVVQGFFSQFEIKVQGTVRRDVHQDNHHEYGIAFVGLSQDTKILIDENVQNDRPVGGNPYSLDI